MGSEVVARLDSKWCQYFGGDQGVERIREGLSLSLRMVLHPTS